MTLKMDYTKNGLWRVYHLDGGTLKKNFQFSKHALRVPPALAIDAGIFQEAVEKGARWVQFYDEENGIYYTASVRQFQERGFKIDRGYGVQIALLLSEWHRSETPIKTFVERRKPRFEQATLF